jgi:hypothetical protein
MTVLCISLWAMMFYFSINSIANELKEIKKQLKKLAGDN